MQSHLGSATTIDTNSTTTDRRDITLGAVTGGSNTLTLTTENNVTGSNVDANGAISGVTTLTLADVGGTARLLGDVDVTTLTVGNTVLNVELFGDGSSIANAVSFANDGTLKLGNATGDTLTFNGGLTTTSVAGTVTLQGTVATSNDAVVLGAVTLGSATTVDTNATNNTADITVAAITGGSNNLTLSTGNNITGADITASGNISGVTTLTLADVSVVPPPYLVMLMSLLLTVGNTVSERCLYR